MVDFFAFSAPSHTKRAKSDYWAESAFSARVLIGTRASNRKGEWQQEKG